MLDWLIIGGGLHGTLLSRALLGSGGVSADSLRVLDPWPSAMHRWRECTANIGMAYLRSSVVHHIDEDPLSLDHSVTGGDASSPFEGPYRRPRLSVFEQHCQEIIAAWGLEALRIQGRAVSISPIEGGLSVETSVGELEARRLVLALGSSDHPAWPAWARHLRDEGACIHHVFEAGFSIRDLEDWQHLVVVGGGISALQTAQALASRAPGRVEVVSRHALRIFDFDTDSTWLGPRRIRTFERIRDWGERRQVISAARHRGSTPPEVAQGFLEAEANEVVRFTLGDVEEGRVRDSVSVLVVKGREVRADVVLLATGFDPQRPGGVLVDSVIERLGLECAACGYPVVDENLRWDRGLFVTGPLAELELGPAARNIHGARLAGKRLVAVARRAKYGVDQCLDDVR